MRFKKKLSYSGIVHKSFALKSKLCSSFNTLNSPICDGGIQLNDRFRTCSFGKAPYGRDIPLI